MKTPRLALLAFLAFAAPFANAGSLPTWTVVEEGPRAWVQVFFKVDTQSKTLRCRYNECKPEVKGISNLYTITPVGTATPIKVTRYKSVERSKLNPRYWTDGPWDHKVVMDVIDAKAQPYASELSHFKLDNTGARLVVVQGDVKYPATTDISQAQYNSYDQLKVAPPTKMIDDVVRPDAPSTRPGQDRPGTAPAAKWWCDPATGEKYSAPRGRRGSTPLASQNAECRKTSAPTSEPVVAPPAPEEKDASLELTKHELRWLTKDQSGNYLLVRKDAKDAAALDLKHRGHVADQIRPEAKAKYVEAHALPPADAPKKIEEAIAKVEMWGGEVKAVVGLFQETPDAKLLEIQLSKAEYEALKKKPAELAAYEAGREPVSGASVVGSDGTAGDKKVFNAKFFDPVMLRLTVVAARKALAGAPAENPATPKPEVEPGTPLTKDEQALLTPKEKMEYENRLAAVAKKEPNSEKALADMSDLLRKRISDEGRKPEPAYAAPKNIDEFKKLPDWHKDIFCDPAVLGPTAAKATAASPEIDNRREAKKGLGSSAKGAENAAAGGGVAAPASTRPDWAQEPCALYLAGKNPRPTTPARPREENSNIGNIGGSSTKKTTGEDVVGKEKDPNKWISKSAITTGIKGGLIGLLIGSLFGPLGLIIGPLAGAALFYGMQRYDEIKADNAKKNKPE